MMGGKREYRAPKGYAPTQDDYRFCLQFVISTSLRLTEAHSHLAPPAWLADEDKAPWLREWETIATGTWSHEGYVQLSGPTIVVCGVDPLTWTPVRRVLPARHDRMGSPWRACLGALAHPS
jgi:hypothetical protein